MELDLIRKELDMYDNAIKNMLAIRMALIPIVAKIKKENNLPLYQGKREDEIYKNIEIFSDNCGIDKELLKDIYKLIISNALKIEDEVIQNENKISFLNEIELKDVQRNKEYFEKLDEILNKDIPKIISNISILNNLNLSKLATIYYNNKINDNNN